MSTSPSQALPMESDSTAGPSHILFFKYNKEEREDLLRNSVHPRDLEALEDVLRSPPWLQQTGELDRFLLQGLLESRSEEDGEVHACRFIGCDYKNGEITNAVEHVRGRHFGNQPFPCPKCRRTFVRKADMLSHQATHEDGAFECEECGKLFAKSWNLSRHRKIHSGLDGSDAQE